MQGRPVNISGYPADKPLGTQWRSYGQVTNANPAAGPQLIYYDLDTCGGHSGSPVWLRWKEYRTLVAIHTGPCILGADCQAVAGLPCFPGGQRYSANRGVLRPTVLIYGHYDVQPAEPLDEWRSPPFEAVVRGNDLYGRGASDDKGQLFAHMKALEAFLQTRGKLPVNVKCLFEGEEEIGSPNLPAFLRRHRQALAADAAVLSDMPMLAPNRPAITESMRGALSSTLSLRRWV